MSAGIGAIQTQWDLGRTTSEAALAIRGLIRACSMDDVQYQAVLAFESLGARLLVSPYRISEAIDALGGRKNERIAAFRLMIGLAGDGLAKEMRSSHGCVSAFTLAIACKTCFDDTTTANILYELMINFGVYKQYPVSEYQLTQLLKAASPYGNQLVPLDQFTNLSEQVFSRLDNSSDMPGLLSELEPKVIADIFQKVFRALQDVDIVRITLEGGQGGIWLATVLLWLDPDNTEVRMERKVIAGHQGSRLAVIFQREHKSHWTFTEWKDQKDVLSLIHTNENNLTFDRRHGLFPQRSAREAVGFVRISEASRELAGQLAGAFVRVAVARAILRLPTINSQRTLSVKLADIAGLDFLAQHHQIATKFGWHMSQEFEQGQERITKSLNRYLDRHFKANNDMFVNAGDFPRRIQLALQDMEDRANADGHELCFASVDINDPAWLHVAINVAAEALYLSLYRARPDTVLPLYMRGSSYQKTVRHAGMIWHTVFDSNPNTAFPFSELRTGTIGLLLCRSDISRSGSDELVVADNGRVVFLNAIMNPCPSKRDCAAVCASFGTIRTLSIGQIPFSLANPNMGMERLEVFKMNEFQGLEPRRDAKNHQIKHHSSIAGKTLQIMTYLGTYLGGEYFTIRLALDWVRSISAILGATDIGAGNSISADTERLIAEDLWKRNVFDKIAWIAPGSSTSWHLYDGYITTTNDNDAMQFFVAGQMSDYRLFLRNGAPLIACIKEAIELREEWGSRTPTNETLWVIIA